MKQNGYVIAKNRSRSVFFSAASSYDHPNWVLAERGTAYPTAELAQQALMKLYKYGAYEAQLVSLTELAPPQAPEQRKRVEPIVPAEGEPTADFDDTAELDDSQDAQPSDVLGSDQEPQAEPEQDAPAQMVADKQAPTDVPPSGELDDTQSSIVEPHDEHDGEEDDDEYDEQLSDQIASRSKEQTTESVIGFVQPSTIVTTSALASRVIHTDSVTVPRQLIKDLDEAIGKHQEQVDGTTFDGVAEYHSNIVTCLKQLKTLLNDKNVESIKKAQLVMMSWMSPIQNEVPSMVKLFVLSGGRPASIKDRFYAGKQ